ncbi:DNA polymerase III subunit delta' [Lactiplantibacillus mudanjiangensis]|uniref:DNA polymerase III subunit delta' [Lactobacillus plantarum JDM1] n=1 Tax=Lactiplantibacillus mudanjiangensis TaxID=1296538 RepID=A0A660E7T4_9LACO|nr:DNA polymerase III subunit delta' [Lactiplantibacillus mudanjiangensis]VDG17979.1 DNA polymerase III subunit delta' [Lactobacillus plantarum JDM1] [Lactiplantibacillus mudanjiangensis]VDG24855.1 DNA polymerase III subunit delta' [Lactobacillus plantarum JDM1] [Lactiplantibacillus mudanjiangensis]VDG28397.1 DNA polymerase III subunit delta' [Lactobacillus plantarum JDM1] [Lactiplantibacillus mudanjiangensis]VDG32318.1 DNA polymerase III subunit delta' [Lactobacillus plantarum JDM1] [Lactiplan
MTTTTTSIATKQPRLLDAFKQIIAQQHLAHAYLFAGMEGAGQLDLATWIAQRLFCLNVVDGEPDGTCEECVRIASGQHPDIVMVAPTGQSIHVEQVRYLKAEFSKSAVEGNRKLFIINDAEKMTASAANSLLKFIEEPSGNVTAFLLTTNKQLMLPTIISRTQVIEFPPLPAAVLQQTFEAAGISAKDAQTLRHLTNSLTQAQALLVDDWLPNAVDQLWQWFQQTVKGEPRSFVAVQTRLVGLAKEREQQLVLLDLIAALFQDLLQLHFDVDDESELSFGQYQSELTTLTTNLNTTQLVAATELGLSAKRQLASNISLQNVLEGLTLQLWPIFKTNA